MMTAESKFGWMGDFAGAGGGMPDHEVT